VGGVVAGVAGILGILLGMWLLRRQKKHKAVIRDEMEDASTKPNEKYAMHAELPNHGQQVRGELQSGRELVELAST
jgi:hypothetical protein